MSTQGAPAYEVPWTARDVGYGLSLLVVLLVMVAGLPWLVPSLFSTTDLGWLVAVGELLLLAPVWSIAVCKYRSDWRTLGLRGFNKEMLGLGCLLMILSYGFNMAYGLILALFNLRIQPNLAPLFGELSSPWPLLVAGALLAPLVEEIFFRGFVFAGLRGRYGWRRAALVSAVLFAVVHFTPTAIIPIIILGYIFAYLYQRSGSLWPAILMHMATNSFALGAAYLLSIGKVTG